MPLNIKMDVDLNGINRLAGDFRKVAGQAHDVGSGAQSARADSESTWGGGSGAGFRNGVGDIRTMSDQASEAANHAASTADQIHGLLTTAHDKKQQARGVASGAGLRVTADEIFEPGPAPKAPGQLPPNATAQQSADHQAATQAQDQYHKQCKAYQDCVRINNEADKARQQAGQLGQAMVGSTPFKNVTTGLSTVASLAGGAISRSQNLRNYAKAYRFMAGGAETSAQMADAVGDNAKYGQAMRDRAGLLDKAAAADEKAAGGLITRNLNKLPPGGQRILTGDYTGGGAWGENLGRVGKSFAKRIPVVGMGVTALTTGVDIAGGKSPGKAIASGVGSTVAGTAGSAAAAGAVSSVGTALGVGEAAGAVAGPVGMVVGAAVGAGVGLLIDNLF